MTIPETNDEPSSFEGNFYLVGDRMLMPIGINEAGHYTFMLDSGGDTDCSIAPECLEELVGKQAKTSKGGTGFSWGAGGGEFKKRGKLEDVTLKMSGFDIENANLTVDRGLARREEDLPVRVDGLISKRILENFNLDIDFRNMRLELTN